MDNDDLQIGLCMTCGRQFLDGICIDGEPARCCKAIAADGTSMIQLFAADDIEPVLALIKSTRAISVITPPQADILCGLCGLDHPTTWVFNTPYREDERLCARCVGLYNNEIWANRDPRELYDLSIEELLEIKPKNPSAYLAEQTALNTQQSTEVTQ